MLVRGSVSVPFLGKLEINKELLPDTILDNQGLVCSYLKRDLCPAWPSQSKAFFWKDKKQKNLGRMRVATGRHVCT